MCLPLLTAIIGSPPTDITLRISGLQLLEKCQERKIKCQRDRFLAYSHSVTHRLITGSPVIRMDSTITKLNILSKGVRRR